MWIKLHTVNSAVTESKTTVVMVQTENITYFLPCADTTQVGFVGDEYNYIFVTESMDKIGALIIAEV